MENNLTANPDEKSKTDDYKDQDYELVQEYIKGNESAFEKLINLHKDKVRNLIFLTLGDTENIDDISQEVFISVFHKVKEFRFESKYTTWLYRITVNKCRDHLRKKKVRSIFSPISDSHYELSSKSNPENLDIPALVRRAIEKLPDKLKVPLVLRDIDGLSYKEIADKLELEVGTIKSRIFRARESLKFILEPYYREMSV